MRDNSWLSILGLYKYDADIFQNLVLPTTSDLDLTLPYFQDSVVALDKDVLTFKILMDLAELPLVYTKPDIVKWMIGRWSTSRKPVWTELWKTTLYKYMPIWNKDGVIEETRNLETSGETTGELSDRTTTAHTITGTTSNHTVTDQDTSETNSGTEDVTTTTDEDTGSSRSGTTSGNGSLNRTVSHNVTGFDTDQYAADTQDVTAETTTTSGTSSETGTGTRDVDEVVDRDWTENKRGTNDVDVTETGSSSEILSGNGSLGRTTGGTSAGTEDETIRRVEQGNIGITTTQQMIREQREIVALDMYQVITDEFKKTFCVMLY